MLLRGPRRAAIVVPAGPSAFECTGPFSDPTLAKIRGKSPHGGGRFRLMPLMSELGMTTTIIDPIAREAGLMPRLKKTSS